METIADHEIAGRAPAILEAVKRGETVTITRDGKPFAKIVPDEEERRAQRFAAIEELLRIRATLPPTTTEEILSAIREGRE